MGTSLKDALKSAGLTSTKTANDRSKKELSSKKNISKHQMQRNFCEVCERVLPDVELYKHKNPTVDAEWICARCADLSMIPDKYRKTNQSDFSKRGTFRREYGETKKF